MPGRKLRWVRWNGNGSEAAMSICALDGWDVYVALRAVVGVPMETRPAGRSNRERRCRRGYRRGIDHQTIRQSPGRIPGVGVCFLAE